MTEPDIAHVVKEILGARVSSTKVILAQILDVAVPSKIVSIFWDLKFNFSSPFRIVDVGFYLTKNFFYYRIGNSLYSQGDSEPTFYNGYLFNNRRKMDARQSTSYLPPITGPIYKPGRERLQRLFIYIKLSATVSASQPWKHSHWNANDVPHKFLMRLPTRQDGIENRNKVYFFLYPTLSNIICESRLEDKGNWIEFWSTL